jgi:cyanophycin synthetase
MPVSESGTTEPPATDPAVTEPVVTEPVVTEEVRLLEGPNLYFTKPAVKVMLSMPGYLEAPTTSVKAVADALGMRARVGEPGSVQRRAFLGRVAQQSIRTIARAAGTSRVGVRVRAGAAPEDVVVAAVWRRRGRAWVLGESLAGFLTDVLAGGEPAALAKAIANEMMSARAGSRPSAITPKVPVASITGTNGKTTTTRLLAHMCMTAGKTTAWSSTDGVVVMGQMVEPGDYSGPAGARGVLETPDLEIGVLETARGGLLLKGMGVTHNDVSVVTNVSADHLGLQGIDTLDQLAEVKAIVTTVTKPDGWTVLNGEDPRVWAMHGRSSGRPWAFALDPTTPALRAAVDAGGRGITVSDGDITVLEPGGATVKIAPLTDVPATLSGLSVHNIANVLAATAAGLGLGLPRAAVQEALRTFNPDDRLNPGRMNIYSLPVSGGTASVILDLAHNEAGLAALLDVARGLAAPGGRVFLALGTAGDRTDDILAALGQIAGQRADHVVIAHKEHYLRGRTLAEFEAHFGAGLALAGVGEAPSHPTELAALVSLAEHAADGDVIAIMTHEQRTAAVEWLAGQGATPDGAADIRRKVVRAQGKHERENAFDALAVLSGEAQVTEATALRAEMPGDARAAYELAGALDAAGREAEAVPLYEGALAGGLPEPHRHRARIQLASSLRNLDRHAEAIALLDTLATERPESAAVAAFRALARLDAGQPDAVVADLIDALLARATDDDANLYRAALTRYADALRARAPQGTSASSS